MSCAGAVVRTGAGGAFIPRAPDGGSCDDLSEQFDPISRTRGPRGPGYCRRRGCPAVSVTRHVYVCAVTGVCAVWASRRDRVSASHRRLGGVVLLLLDVTSRHAWTKIRVVCVWIFGMTHLSCSQTRSRVGLPKKRREASPGILSYFGVNEGVREWEPPKIHRI